jgi:hypothetical protein
MSDVSFASAPRASARGVALRSDVVHPLYCNCSQGSHYTWEAWLACWSRRKR